ncbi:MAG TPA: hypothetical protein VNW90_15625 [Acetobacteraceae bacterium]|nr:hypothetical protein [Acetobacteraceae bacterium]
MPAEITGRLDATVQPTTLQATGTVVSLDQEAERERLSVTDQIALRDADLRKSMSDTMLRIFRRANFVTLLALGALVILDECNIRHGLIQPNDRIIDHQVFIALLGATTVQVGTIAIIMAQYLFPGSRR